MKKRDPKDQGKYEPIEVASHRDLGRHRRVINERFNNDPEMARLLLVNPIYAMEDIGVRMTPEIRDHIIETLRFPSRLKERLATLENELQTGFQEVGFAEKLPLNGEQRARLVFEVLKLQPAEPEAARAMEPKQLQPYSGEHELLAKLAEYERLRHGAQIFAPRAQYDAYKRGEKRHNWVRRVRFKI